MDQDSKQKIARVFEGNLGNRLSEELANGMLQKILTLIEENQGKPLDTKEVEGDNNGL